MTIFFQPNNTHLLKQADQFILLKLKILLTNKYRNK